VSVDSHERDELFHALSDDRRLTVLTCLSAADRSLAMSDLAREVAAREREEPSAEIPYSVIETVYLALYHKHVPALAEAEIVHHDPERDLVGPGPRFPDVESILPSNGVAADDD
jgi:hypothetical protein